MGRGAVLSLHLRRTWVKELQRSCRSFGADASQGMPLSEVLMNVAGFLLGLDGHSCMVTTAVAGVQMQRRTPRSLVHGFTVWNNLRFSATARAPEGELLAHVPSIYCALPVALPDTSRSVRFELGLFHHQWHCFLRCRIWQ